MKGQWGIILGLLLALVIAVFAVINVESVRVNYLFGIAEWPLILIILVSVIMGAIIVGALGMVKIYQLQTELKKLKNESVDDTSLEMNETSEEKVKE